MPVEKVREILRVAQEPVSLETPIGEEEDSHLGDFIKDDNVPVPADAAAFTLLSLIIMILIFELQTFNNCNVLYIIFYSKVHY